MHKNIIKIGNKYRVRVTRPNGTRSNQYFESLDDAIFHRDRILLENKEIRRGLKSLTRGTRRFEELCEHWLQNRAAVKKSGKKDESFIRRKLLPTFGNLRLGEITYEHITRFRTSMLNEFSPKTVNLHLGLLKAMLNEAVSLQWLAVRPTIKMAPMQKNRRICYLRNTEERDRLLLAAKDESPLLFALYATAIFTGLRKGELAALRWSDINFEQRQITVSRGHHGSTKSNTVRHVPIVDAVYPILKEWQLKSVGGLVFPNRDGNQHDESARVFQEKLRRCLNNAGLQDLALTFHGLRHTFASHFLMAGGDMFVLKNILGHVNVRTTMIYAHFSPDIFAKDLARFSPVAAPSKETSSAMVINLNRSKYSHGTQ